MNLEMARMVREQWERTSMARMTIDYDGVSNPGVDAVTWLCGQEIIEHLRNSIHDGEALEHHISTMNTLLEPIIDRLCTCNVVTKISEVKAA